MVLGQMIIVALTIFAVFGGVYKIAQQYVEQRYALAVAGVTAAISTQIPIFYFFFKTQKEDAKKEYEERKREKE